MKILMLFQTSPYPADLGPSKRNTPFFLENIKRHQVSVLAFGTKEQENCFREQYGDRCEHIVFDDNNRPRVINFFLRLFRLFSGQSSVRWLYKGTFKRKLADLLARERFDVIHCCTPLFGYYDLPENIRLVGDAHNVGIDFSMRTYRQERNPLLKIYYYLDYLFMRSEEFIVTKKFDVITTPTEIDRQKLLGMFPSKRIVVIPNGVDPPFLERHPVKEEQNTMVFTGLMSYQPNYQGIMYFLDEIFPLILQREPLARVAIVGALPPKALQRRARNNIIVTGWVDDVKPYFARGQVFIIPLLVGGGIRGKALEAMAMKRPIVTTTIGCEGINLHHEESALFADTPHEFADAVLRLFKDVPLRRTLTENAYRNVCEGYSWKGNGEALEAVYQSLTSASNAKTASPNLNRNRGSKDNRQYA